jgi:hypothetical protein
VVTHWRTFDRVPTHQPERSAGAYAVEGRFRRSHLTTRGSDEDLVLTESVVFNVNLAG